MCGIAGIITKTGGVNPGAVEAMAQAMIHRGPDDGGTYISRERIAGLANRRLAVIDLSPAGHQPMSTPDGRFTIVHNGEVYNYREIRKTLKAKGYRFASDTDTEVVLYAYAEWGKACLEKFRGMFAFAVWDDIEKKLFLARDRLGIKPVYYYENTGAFLFASELKALKSSGLVSTEINPAALVAHLMLGSVPCPMTIYRGTKALEPGTYLVWKDGHTTLRSYWDFDEEEPAERVRELLLESVNLRMISDVPLGAFLSGGLDSSAVVALMRKVTNGTIRTCSMVFEEEEYSEAPYAGAVAKAFETEHYERVITLQDLKREWDKIFWAMDQPTIDGVNTYFVSQTAKDAGLTVALSGLGGDELFGGYANTFYQLPRLLQTLKRIQAVPGAPGLASRAVKLFSRDTRYQKLSDAFTRPATPASAYLAMRGLFSPGEVKSLVSPEIWQEAVGEYDPVAHISEKTGASTPHPSRFTSDALFNWVSRAELRNYTHNQLLRDTDAMSMAHSLEVRVPLLDHRLVSFVLSLAPALKNNGKMPKSLLIKAVGDRLPKIVVERRQKQGFTFPFAVWLKEIFEKNPLETGQTSAFFKGDETRKILHNFTHGKTGWSRPWAILVFDRWIKENGF